MRLGFVSDVHCANYKRMGGPVESGLNRRCRQVLATLARAVEQARKMDCLAFFVAGDLVDSAKPEPQVIAALQSVLIKAHNPCLLLGNHDLVSEQAGDHALGPFAPVATVVDKPMWQRSMYDGVEVLCLPFRSGNARDWLPKAVAEQCKGRTRLQHRVLLLHLGLEEDETPAYLKGLHEAVPAALVVDLCKSHGFEAAFSGDWHFHKILNEFPMVAQIGTLAPTGFDNPGLEGHGSLLVWDTEAGKMKRIEIPGPRFVRMCDTESFPELGPGYDLYAQILAPPERVAECVASLDSYRGKAVVDGEVVTDAAESRAAARTAATLAKSAQTLEEALMGFISQMPLPEGVSREEVLAQAKRYLG